MLAGQSWGALYSAVISLVGHALIVGLVTFSHLDKSVLPRILLPFSLELNTSESILII